MKKSIGIVSFTMLICTSSLYAMELVELENVSKKSLSINGYESLTENAFDMIQEQKKVFSNPVVINLAYAYLDAVHASLKLDQISRAFCALPAISKREVMSIMSIQLLHLHALVLCFPPEIVNHIIFCMLNGEKEALEYFYALPFTDAFDLYHEIKTKLADDTKPVGPLYAKSQQVRDLILKVQKKPWYYSRPIVDFENKGEIDLLSGDIKNMYLHDKQILVLPDDEHNRCTQKNLCTQALISGGLGLGSFGALSAVFGMLGACGACGTPAGIACSPFVLVTNSVASFGSGGFFFCMLYGGEGCRSLYHHSQEVTI